MVFLIFGCYTIYMAEITLRTIEWHAPEYSHKEKSADFLWAIGLVALVGAGLALWFHNYLFAIFIVISGISLIFFSIRKPEEMAFSISTDGIAVGKDKYSWTTIKGFNIKKGDPYNKLMIVTSKYFLPVYTIPLPQGLRNEVEEDLLKVIPSIEMEESRSMLFMEKLGF